MKRLIAGCLASGLVSLAHAQLLVAPGTKATLTVEYSYVANGAMPGKYDSKDWKVRRTVTLTAKMEAGKQQSLPSVHQQDAAQQADMKGKQDKARSVAKTMTPMANDMLSIVSKCGEDEACITREVQKYGGNMQMTPEMKQAGNDITAIGKEGPARYQVWKLASLTGNYAIDESYSGQTTEVTEGPARKFSRSETRKGSGPIPAADAKSAFAQFEVDSVGKDMILTLPVLANLVSVTRVVTSTVPGEKSGTSSMPVRSIGEHDDRTTANLAGGLKEVKGMQVVRQKGVEGEEGVLTVTWRVALD